MLTEPEFKKLRIFLLDSLVFKQKINPLPNYLYYVIEVRKLCYVKINKKSDNILRLKHLTKIIFLLKDWKRDTVSFRMANKAVLQAHLAEHKILSNLNIKNAVVITEEDDQFKALHRLIRDLEFKLFGFLRNQKIVDYSSPLFLIQRQLVIIEQTQKKKAKIKYELSIKNFEFVIVPNLEELHKKLEILSTNVVEARKILKSHLQRFIV